MKTAPRLTRRPQAARIAAMSAVLSLVVVPHLAVARAAADAASVRAAPPPATPTASSSPARQAPSSARADAKVEAETWLRAERHAALAAEGFERCHRYLQAWLRQAEPTSGLIPRNLKDSPYWNGKDSAADNYPFMVLSAWFTDRAAFDGPMRRMLAEERRLTARRGWLRLVDDVSLKGGAGPALRFPAPDAERILFNSAEYVKDGLLALTEWLGPSPWSERMIELVDDSFAVAAVDTFAGRVPMEGRNTEAGVEVSGDYLQALARIYWLSGRQEKYLEWGARLADLYLLPEGHRHPTRDFTTLRLRDHGCEIVSGLCEFYVTLHHAGLAPGGERWAAKRAAYRPHLHEMLDRILAVARNPDGFFYNAVDPRTGRVTDARLSDSWGYVLDGYYAVSLVDGEEAYREAALKPLRALDAGYRGFSWEPSGNAPGNPRGSQDGYADALESALNLLNRIPEAADPGAVSASAWLDSEIRELWSRQRDGGLIEGWHGDGNFARTTLMYCLWKTQGATVHPWRADVRVGAVRLGAGVALVVSAEKPWQGVVTFDRARHREALRLPIDWPRINQFPEWFVAEAGSLYRLERYKGEGPREESLEGGRLREGLPVRLEAGRSVAFAVYPLR